MKTELERNNSTLDGGGFGFYEQSRGLLAVWGKEAVQFLDGMVTNDMKTLADGEQMLAAFSNAQGRLIAVVRILRSGDRFLIETEEATRLKVFQNLFRFTFAGDFYVEDWSENYSAFEVFGNNTFCAVDAVWFDGRPSRFAFVSKEIAGDFISDLTASGRVPISDAMYETIRIENGVPLYGIDIDETTIVPELGLDGLISYNKGCYIGQEIIARIHFRGHVAKRLTGIVSEPGAIATGLLPGAELTTHDGKNAGRITSVTFSPKLDKQIALAFVRYDYLSGGTRLTAGDLAVIVTGLPFIG